MIKKWHLRSIKFRLMFWYTAVLVFILVIYAAAVVAFLRGRLYADLDRRLQQDIEVAEQMLQVTNSGVVEWRADNRDDDHQLNQGKTLLILFPQDFLQHFLLLKISFTMD